MLYVGSFGGYFKIHFNYKPFHIKKKKNEAYDINA